MAKTSGGSTAVTSHFAATSFCFLVSATTRKSIALRIYLSDVTQPSIRQIDLIRSPDCDNQAPTLMNSNQNTDFVSVPSPLLITQPDSALDIAILFLKLPTKREESCLSTPDEEGSG